MLHARSANLAELASDCRANRSLGHGVSVDIAVPGQRLGFLRRGHVAFACEVVAHLAEAGGPVPPILDQTKASARHQVLMLSARWGERDLPVASRVKEIDGAVGFSMQKDLLEAVCRWVNYHAWFTRGLRKAIRLLLRPLLLPKLWERLLN